MGTKKVRPGTLVESLMTTLFLMRALIDKTKIVAQVHASLGNKEAAAAALEQYQEAIVPFGTPTEQKDEEMRKKLEKEVAKGPLKITVPPPPPKFRSRLLQRNGVPSPPRSVRPPAGRGR